MKESQLYKPNNNKKPWKNRLKSKKPKKKKPKNKSNNKKQNNLNVNKIFISSPHKHSTQLKKDSISYS